jgi:hypothetical protein
MTFGSEAVSGAEDLSTWGITFIQDDSLMEYESANLLVSRTGLQRTRTFHLIPNKALWTFLFF